MTPRPDRPHSPLVRALRAHTTGLVGTIAAVAAVAAALSPARPVGLRGADALWCALLGAVVVLAASRASRGSMAWLGGIAAVVGIGGDTTAIVCAIAVSVLIAIVALTDRPDPLLGALIGALAVQALLRGPTYGFLGLPTLVGAVAVVPTIWSGFRRAGPRSRRVALRLGVGATIVISLASVGAALAAISSRDDFQAGADGATAGLDLVRDGDTPEAAAAFDEAADRFGDANATLESPLTWVGRFVPVVGQHVDALRRVSAAGQDLGESAAVTASTADYRSLTADGGVVDVARVIALQEPLDQSAATLDAALDTATGVRSPWLAPMVDTELDRFEDKLRDISEQTDLAADGLAVAPALLGAEGSKRYFIAFATPAESRNGGGFVGAFGLLEADGGRLTLLESGDLASLNPSGRPANAYAFDPPPDWQERYGSYFVQLFLGNIAASPDWPTSAGVAGQLFPQTAVGTPVDGAVYADPAALAGMLELTGPVNVPGIDMTLDASNVEQFLLVDQYVAFDDDARERKDLLGDVADATFDALTSRPLPGITTLTDVLGPLVNAGHLKVSVFDPAPEAFLERIGLSGRWSITPGSDYLSIRSADLDSNKIDSFLFRDFDVVTVLAPDTGTQRSTITATLRNDAPAGGLPDYIIGNGDSRPPGTNPHLLTVHTPLALDSVTIDGVRTGSTREREFDGPVYSVFVEIPPGSTRTVTMELSGAVPSWPYRLEILPQATANPDRMTVWVNGADGLGPAPQFSGNLGPTLQLGE